MAAEQGGARSPRDADDESAQTNPAEKGGWRRFVKHRWVAILLVVSVVAQAAGLIYLQTSRKRPAPKAEPEVALGDFQFSSDRQSGGKAAGAQFSLYITFLEHLDQAARGELDAHRFRVQQAIEQLLRQAHGKDFEDPALEQLKRQIQEQINGCLQMRAVGEVIIVNLRRQPGDGGIVPAGVAADSRPRTE